jgi:hypothetical protein
MWIHNLRYTYGKSVIRNTLTQEQVNQLESIGMLWEHIDYQWNRNYDAAEKYFKTNEHLNVPASYVTDDGFRLGMWIRYLRQSREGKIRSRSLTEEQIVRLDAIGMIWENSYDNVWKEKYNEAKQFYIEHEHLRVPVTYITPTGLRLGQWLYNHQEAKLYPDRKSNHQKLTVERIKLLEEIGIVWWDGEDTWEKRYKLAKNYYMVHGNLDIRQNYVAEGNIWLGKWLYEQRRTYHGEMAGKQLTDDQVRKLEAIGMKWEFVYRKRKEKNMENDCLKIG